MLLLPLQFAQLAQLEPTRILWTILIVHNVDVQVFAALTVAEMCALARALLTPQFATNGNML